MINTMITTNFTNPFGNRLPTIGGQSLQLSQFNLAPPETLQSIADQVQVQTTTTNQLISPLELFHTQEIPNLMENVPAYLEAGNEIAAVASQYGYERGQVIEDKAVIEAMMNKAGEIYGIPGDYLSRVADKESRGNHWNSRGRVRSAAAVGIMQIEKSAYPNAMKGGRRNAVNNVYDIANNIAFSARNARNVLNEMVTESNYQGQNAWQDLGPLLNISYNAGSGALNIAQNIARRRGLDPFNWQHLAFGKEIEIKPGRLRVQKRSVERAPLHRALKAIHDSRARQGLDNYPIYWEQRGAVRSFDFDGNGIATRAERLISRIHYTMTGERIRAV